jgi:nucleotide-binding universal stress UspA family protein
VPYAGRFDTAGRSVRVAWNATREAARAMNDAMVILQEAEKVAVLTVNPPSEEAAATRDIDVGNAILSRAADFGSDLIVMGGYGHSRRREFIPVEITRTLLGHMTVPVIMSH